MSSATGFGAPSASASAVVQLAIEAPRIRIEHVAPCLDGGALPGRGIVGQTVVVEADIFMDGCEPLAARLVWRAPATLQEHSRPMVPLGNDRWRAEFMPTRVGRHRFNVEAWVDAKLQPRRFVTHLPTDLIVDVERPAASFASWYELFPRSQSPQAGVHGNFDDVIARLPAIRDMGFDVLCLPPIHPIGHDRGTERNRGLETGVGDPFAIGTAEGGHTAVHAQLGGLVAFRRLLAAAAEHGMEVALDFAAQCSGEHPWLRSHPEWFQRGTDGSVPQQDASGEDAAIVHFDFYAEGAKPQLWLALRDVVLYWVDVGVRAFRVHAPQNQPLPFWRWLIAEVRARHPEVLFLSQAFTPPAMMYRLAKIGFSHSYSYFIWRNSKRELTEYFTELTTQAPRDFFRPHLFVNTPDINPFFLQGSGRPGFLIRAALAATLSGLWGIYSGFELCESAAPPGREQYLQSERHRLRQRNWLAPGNIIAEIAQLNRIRREQPALQSHLWLRFYNAFNEQVLWYGRATPDRSDFILVAVSLDAHNAQETYLEVPLWEFGLEDDAVLQVEELMRGARFQWRGKRQHWRFVPGEMPFAIFRVQPGMQGP